VRARALHDGATIGEAGLAPPYSRELGTSEMHQALLALLDAAPLISLPVELRLTGPDLQATLDLRGATFAAGAAQGQPRSLGGLLCDLERTPR
jgi:hypothetical protein